MAILYMSDIKGMKESEWESKYNDLCEELMSERSSIVTGGNPEKPGRIKEIKKAIARLLTYKNQLKKS